MSYKHTMKIGFIDWVYTPPREIKDPLEYVKWQINKSEELGCDVFQVGFPCPEDDNSLKILRELAESKNIELEFRAPYEIYSLSGSNSREALVAVKEEIRKAKLLGAKIMRNGYGRFSIDTTRFSKKIPLKQHLQFIISNLKEAAKIFEDEGIYLAIENHCDFTGKEWAEVFSAVGSPYVGCALDTGNGYTVYCDPNEDIEVLAEFTITTHIKDMQVIEFNSGGNLIPFQARGCALGEGNVDISRAIDLLDQKSPHANGLHLILELGWANYKEGIDRDVQNKILIEQSLRYLKNLLNRN